MSVTSLLRSWHAALAASILLFGLFVVAPADGQGAAPPIDHFPVAAKSAAKKAATKQAHGQRNQNALGKTAKKDKKHHKHHKKHQQGQKKGPAAPTTTNSSSSSGGVAQGSRNAANSNRNEQAGSRDTSKLRRVLK